MAQRIGFIGIGNQGAPIARRIVDAGFDLSLWARRSAALAEFADTPARIVGSVEELGAQCDVVGLCVLADADVAEVAGRLLSAMQPGSVLLIHSTVSPQLCRDLARRGEGRGIAVLDAPVSGGNARAREGKMAVMVGGPADVFERVRPVLATFATTVVRLGDVGAGQLGKLVNNAVTTAKFSVSLAFLDAGEQLGLDRAALGQAMLAGAGQSFALERMVEATAEGLRFALPLLEKDVGLMRAVLAEGAPGASQAQRLMEDGIAAFRHYARD